MPRVTFVREFHYRPTVQVWQTIQPGRHLVTTALANAAREAGALADVPEPIAAAVQDAPPADPDNPEGTSP